MIDEPPLETFLLSHKKMLHYYYRHASEFRVFDYGEGLNWKTLEIQLGSEFNVDYYSAFVVNPSP